MTPPRAGVYRSESPEDTSAGTPRVCAAHPPERTSCVALADFHRARAVGAGMFELAGFEEGLDCGFAIGAFHIGSLGITDESALVVLGGNLHVGHFALGTGDSLRGRPLGGSGSSSRGRTSC